MPVLLIVVHLENDRAYWVSIKDYFQLSEDLPSLKVTFDKIKDNFTADSYSELIKLSRDYNAGLYLGPIPHKETLFTNLLHVEEFPKQIWIAATEYRRPNELWLKLNEDGHRVGSDWLLHEKSIVSFQDLSMPPWNKLCDQGTCEYFDVGEWAYTTDVDRRRQFVDLLNRALREQLYPEVRFWGKLECFAFSAKPEIAPLVRRYRSVRNISALTVVADYTKKRKDGGEFVLLRHLAFRARFRLFDNEWYLEITPTYVFTWDGYRIDRFHESRLRKIKQIEGNRAVLSSVLCWADTLRGTKDLYRHPPSLHFGDLAIFDTTTGIDDSAWLKGDEEHESLDTDDYDDLLTSLGASEPV